MVTNFLNSVSTDFADVHYPGRENVAPDNGVYLNFDLR